MQFATSIFWSASTSSDKERSANFFTMSTRIVFCSFFIRSTNNEACTTRASLLWLSKAACSCGLFASGLIVSFCVTCTGNVVLIAAFLLHAALLLRAALFLAPLFAILGLTCWRNLPRLYATGTLFRSMTSNSGELVKHSNTQTLRTCDGNGCTDASASRPPARLVRSIALVCEQTVLSTIPRVGNPCEMYDVAKNSNLVRTPARHFCR